MDVAHLRCGGMGDSNRGHTGGGGGTTMTVGDGDGRTGRHVL